MPAVAYTEIIERAKQAADMNDGFPSDATWLYWLNAEYKKLWVRLIRSGYPPAISNESITADGSSQYNIDEPSAVIAVYGVRSSGSTLKYFRVPVKHAWQQIRSSVNSYPYECYLIPNHIYTGQIGIVFQPNPTSGTYLVVTIPQPYKVVSGTPTPGANESNSVYLPFGWEERIVLGMARRALTKEETVNPSLEREINEVDEQIDTHIHDYIMQQANTAGAMDDFPSSFGVNYPILNYPVNYSEWVYL